MSGTSANSCRAGHWVQQPGDSPATWKTGAVFPVRSAGRALIIHDDRLLVTVLHGDDGEFWLLPGGGQDHGEPLPETVRRECREEIGCDVIVGDLAVVRDYVQANHEFARFDSTFHQVDLVFHAQLVPGAEPCLNTPDERQVAVRWVPLAEVPTSPLYPQALRGWLAADPELRPRYLGDVN